jgi:NitT/TauT family transport system substrate-binding protein
MRFSYRPLAAWGRIVAVVAVVGAGAIAFAANAAASNSHAKKLTTLRITYNPNPSNTPVVVAQQEGFFKKNGIKAELTASPDTTQLLPSVGKKIDIDNTTPANVLQGQLQGYDPVLIASEDVETKSFPDSYLIVQKGINSIADLKGKTIGVLGLSGGLYEGVVDLLSQHGISKNQVKFQITPLSDQIGDMLGHTVDAVVTIVPFGSVLEGKGLQSLANPILGPLHANGALDLGWVANGKWAKAHPSLVAAFIKSQKEAITWMKSHHAAVVSIFEKDFQLPAASAASYPQTGYLNLNINPKYLTEWIKPMQNAGDLPKSFKVPVSKMIFKP